MRTRRACCAGSASIACWRSCSRRALPCTTGPVPEVSGSARAMDPSPPSRRDPLHNLSHGATAFQVARLYWMLATDRLLSPPMNALMKQVLSNPGIHHKFVKGLDSRPGADIYRKSGHLEELPRRQRTGGKPGQALRSGRHRRARRWRRMARSTCGAIARPDRAACHADARARGPLTLRSPRAGFAPAAR